MSTALVVETREIDPVDDLLSYADPDRPLVWLRRGEGIVAAGSAVRRTIRVTATPAGIRAPELSRAWDALVADARIDDPVQLPGTGLVGFSALVFDDASAADSVIVVPAEIIGRHGGHTWRTTVREEGAPALPPAAPLPYGPHWSGTLGPGAQSPQGYQDAVRAALAGIAAGAYGKVVLARDLVGSVPAGSDLRRLVRALGTDYPDTWTFAVDGLVGASPETLVTAQRGAVTARVLAGTAPRGADTATDARAAADLAASAKDRDEHAFAVRSVVAALAPHTRALDADGGPFVLELPNLFHLATDVRGERGDSASALDLAAALHPTAAVAGTPTPAAVAAIRGLEPFDRGRYAGPVGWIDAGGDGEWAIALRCAQFGGLRPDAVPAGAAIPVTAYAGAGIVAGSDPESELRETRVKFRPIVDALA